MLLDSSSIKMVVSGSIGGLHLPSATFCNVCEPTALAAGFEAQHTHRLRRSNAGCPLIVESHWKVDSSWMTIPPKPAASADGSLNQDRPVEHKRTSDVQCNVCEPTALAAGFGAQNTHRLRRSNAGCPLIVESHWKVDSSWMTIPPKPAASADGSPSLQK